METEFLLKWFPWFRVNLLNDLILVRRKSSPDKFDSFYNKLGDNKINIHLQIVQIHQILSLTMQIAIDNIKASPMFHLYLLTQSIQININQRIYSWNDFRKIANPFPRID